MTTRGRKRLRRVEYRTKRLERKLGNNSISFVEYLCKRNFLVTKWLADEIASLVIKKIDWSK